MPWVSLATALLKLSGALMDYAERRGHIRQGELQAYHDASQRAANRAYAACEAIRRARVDDDYRQRLRDKYGRERVLPDSAAPADSPRDG